MALANPTPESPALDCQMHVKCLGADHLCDLRVAMCWCCFSNLTLESPALDCHMQGKILKKIIVFFSYALFIGPSIEDIALLRSFWLEKETETLVWSCRHSARVLLSTVLLSAVRKNPTSQSAKQSHHGTLTLNVVQFCARHTALNVANAKARYIIECR